MRSFVVFSTGNDWKWGSQDGGSGSIGYVYEVNESSGIVQVL